MLILTFDKKLAIHCAMVYIMDNNIGYNKAWEDVNQFEIECGTYHKSMEDFILYLCNQEFLISPSFKEITENEN